MDILGLLNSLEPATRLLRDGISVVSMMDFDQPLIYVNPAFERVTGWSKEEVLGRNCRFLQGAETSAEDRARIRETIAAGRTAVVVIRNYRRDGTPFWNELKLFPLEGPEGEISHYVGIQTDVTAEVETEKLTRISTELRAELLTSVLALDSAKATLSSLRPLEDILGTLRFGIVQVDAEGRVGFMNRTASAILEIDPGRATGVPLRDIVGDDSQILALARSRISADGPEMRQQAMLTLVSGNRREVGISIQRDPTHPGACVLVIRSLEEIESSQDRIRHLERLSTMGRMTASFAHQIRNPLAAIRASCEILEMHLEDDAESQRHLKRVAMLVERVQRLIHNSLRLTQPRPACAVQCSAMSLVEEALALLEPTWSLKGERPGVTAAGGPIEIRSDPDQVVEALVAILENAADVVDSGGAIHVQLTRANPGEGSMDREMALIEIRDRGPGIPRRDMAHLFEPFFTTKSTGTGLGLSIAARNIEAVGGRLRLAAADVGSCFQIFLPLADAEPPA